jgi:hypothetical protein
LNLISTLIPLLPVPTYSISCTYGLLILLVFSCNSTYNVVGGISSILTKFEFDSFERQQGIHSIFSELSMQIVQHPIELTVAGFYVITKTFLSSVRGLRVEDWSKDETKVEFAGCHRSYDISDYSRSVLQ